MLAVDPACQELCSKSTYTLLFLPSRLLRDSDISFRHLIELQVRRGAQ